MNKIILNKKAMLPELVANGVKKWCLLDYDEFVHKGFLNNFCLWGDNKIELDIDIFEYYDRKNFKEFSYGSIAFGAKPLSEFLFDNVIDGQPRELFLQTAFISDYKNIVVYLSKSEEIVLIGILKEELRESFENEFISKLPVNLPIRLSHIVHFYMNCNFDIESFMKEFIKNYFPDFLYEFKYIPYDDGSQRLKIFKSNNKK